MKRTNGESLIQENSEKAAKASERKMRKVRGSLPLLSLDFSPVSFDEDTTIRPDLFRDVGLFTISCTNSMNPGDNRRYLIESRSGFVENYCKICRFYNWESFVSASKKNKGIQFILKTTPISRELFELAKKNYGTRIPFCVDIQKYISLCGGETCFTSEAQRQADRQKSADAGYVDASVEGLRAYYREHEKKMAALAN